MSRQVPVQCEGGDLFCDGERFSKGSSVVLEVNDDSPAQAVITGISTGEVWFKLTDGTKTKIYISQLQKDRQVPVQCEGGDLFCDGERFSKGSSVVLEVNDDSPAQAVITGISTGEVWFKLTDGTKTKIYISQLQKDRQVPVQCEGGDLFCDGERFSKGSSVVLEVNDDSPAQAVITGISTGEVWFKLTDGTKTKIYISQLQKGKYTIRKA